jgi:hypothetical protein
MLTGAKNDPIFIFAALQPYDNSYWQQRLLYSCDLHSVCSRHTWLLL